MIITSQASFPLVSGGFKRWKKIGLMGNRLSGEIPASIGNLTKLFEIALEWNRLGGTIPPSIVNCQKLQNLDISQNKLNGSIPQQFISLSSLLILDLSHNSFTGELPEVNCMKNIYYLDVLVNNLIGNIPSSIGICLNLEYISLQVVGVISTSIPLNIRNWQ